MLLIIWASFWKAERNSKIAEFSTALRLNEEVADKRDVLLGKSAEKGIQVVITEGFRSKKEQNALFAKGRTAKGNIVTNAKAGESYHNYGLAIDFALKNKNGEIIWDMDYDGNGNGKSDWMEVVELAKSIGFEWGGDWVSFKDYPHLEMNFGVSIQELKKAKSAVR